MYKEIGGTISLIVMMSICLTTSVCLESTVQEVTITIFLILLKQEPLKEEPLKEKPLKEEPLISRTSCFSDLWSKALIL